MYESISEGNIKPDLNQNYWRQLIITKLVVQIDKEIFSKNSRISEKVMNTCA